MKLTIDLPDGLAELLMTVSKISGEPMEKVALFYLHGSDYIADDAGEILSDAFHLLPDGGDVAGMVERFRQHRDAHGMNYPDYVIEADIMRNTGESDDDEHALLIRAGNILTGRNGKMTSQ